jgi:exodeoxyribonuclease-3
MEGYWCYWHGEGGYSGVGLHIRKGLSPQRPHFAHPRFDFEHRIVSAQLGAVTVASIYVPNGGKNFSAKMRFLEALDAYAGELLNTKRGVLLCGDFNVTAGEADVHPKERKTRAIGQLPEERAILERIVGRGLVDVGRAVDPENDALYTWWPPWRKMRERNIGWRIDYVFADRALAARVESCRVQKDVGTSDHAPIVASFLLDTGVHSSDKTPAASAGASEPIRGGQNGNRTQPLPSLRSIRHAVRPRFDVVPKH